MAEINCPQTFGNMGSPCPTNVDKGALIGIIPAAYGFSMPIADFVDSDAHDTAIRAKLIFPMMELRNPADVSDEDRRDTAALGKEIPLGYSPYKLTGEFHLTEDQHKVLFASNYRAYFPVYSNNYIDGWSEDGITVKPISLSSFEVGKWTRGTGEAASFTMVRLVEKNPLEFNRYPIVGYPDWFLEDKKSLTNVVVSVVSSSALEIVVDLSYVKSAMVNGSGANPTVPITPIPDADFVFLTAAGAPQTPSGAGTDNLDGTYTFPFAALETGTVDLKTPPNMINAFFIESTGAAAITI